MKSLVYKLTERHPNGEIERTSTYILGVCVYRHQYPVEPYEKKPRNVGFIQYPSDAPTSSPDEDYYPDEY